MTLYGGRRQERCAQSADLVVLAGCIALPLRTAEHCLGNMQHVRGARALREAKANIEEADARVGAVAVHLGMVEDAKKLFIQAER